MEACIVGASPSLMWPLPSLLSRAGFTVDVIATSGLLRASRFVRRLEQVETLDQAIEAAYVHIRDRERPYDWVIACDDETLVQLSRLEWQEGVAPRHLTRTRAGSISHIYSKIGLAHVLLKAGVQMPAFRLTSSCDEAVAAAHALGYPVLLKTDSASGGTGVRECRSDEDILRLKAMFSAGPRLVPLLVQKKIVGQELALSAIYFEQKLVHFSYAVVERTRNQFGVSNVRRYTPPALVESAVVQELSDLGVALDADGFASISCMEAADGPGGTKRRYYFEADMRPNAWSDISRFYGDDAAPRIHDWFLNGATLRRDEIGSAEDCRPVTVPHFARIALWELMLNRFRVWRFIPWEDWPVVLCLLCSRALMPMARTAVPGRVRRAVKRGMLGLGVPFP